MGPRTSLVGLEVGFSVPGASGGGLRVMARLLADRLYTLRVCRDLAAVGLSPLLQVDLRPRRAKEPGSEWGGLGLTPTPPERWAGCQKVRGSAGRCSCFVFLSSCRHLEVGCSEPLHLTGGGVVLWQRGEPRQSSLSGLHFLHFAK